MSLAGIQQRSAVGRVIAIVFKWISNRFRHNRMRREMHDGVDVILAKEAFKQRGITGIADD